MGEKGNQDDAEEEEQGGQRRKGWGSHVNSDVTNLAREEEDWDRRVAVSSNI